MEGLAGKIKNSLEIAKIKPTDDNMVPTNGKYTPESLKEMDGLREGFRSLGITSDDIRKDSFNKWLSLAARLGKVDELGEIDSFAPKTGLDVLPYLHKKSELLINAVVASKNRGEREESLSLLKRFRENQEKIKNFKL